MEYARIQSPSSISTYKQCPRKYFYRYLQKLPSKPSIHLTRGWIVHKVLEDFFDINLTTINPFNFKDQFDQKLKNDFHIIWTNDKKVELDNLGLPFDNLQMYYDESVVMLQNFLEDFCKRLTTLREKGTSLHEAFRMLTPRREENYVAKNFGVQGNIDCVFGTKNIAIVDYKTSKKDIITVDYARQLKIYALLYKHKTGVEPKYLGIHFLKTKKKWLKFDPQMLDEVALEIAEIHQQTKSKEIKDYPQSVSPLCKYSTGECEFYGECFCQKTL